MVLSHQAGHATKDKRILLFLPLVLFPFITFLFWAAGGGKDNEGSRQNMGNIGLNLELPEAQMKNEKATDKLSFYQQASKDSLKREEERRSDPSWNGIIKAGKDSLSLLYGASNKHKDFSGDYNPLSTSSYASNSIDENETKVYQKLAQLNSALASSKDVAKEKTNPITDYNLVAPSSATDTKKLEAMMRGMNESSSKDPELEQLNTMLDKIAAIQHPDDENHSSLSEDSSANRNTQAVHGKKKPAIVSLLQPMEGKNNQGLHTSFQKTGFYNDATSATTIDSGKVNTFRAIIPQTQIVASGATVQLQLSQDIDINGIPIRKGSYVFGIASLSNERLFIKVSSIQCNNDIYPVSLEVYDLDGLTGVYIPGSMTRETAKQSADRAINGMGLTTLDPSIGAQAASAGIEAAKSLIGKKAKLVKVTLPAGYGILLRDSHSN